MSSTRLHKPRLRLRRRGLRLNQEPRTTSKSTVVRHRLGPAEARGRGLDPVEQGLLRSWRTSAACGGANCSRYWPVSIRFYRTLPCEILQPDGTRKCFGASSFQPHRTGRERAMSVTRIGLPRPFAESDHQMRFEQTPNCIIARCSCGWSVTYDRHNPQLPCQDDDEVHRTGLLASIGRQ
jgi:hypothetical protein